MTAAEIESRHKENEHLRQRILLNETAINTILVTVARMDGCKMTDTIRLNEKMTGIIVEPAPEVPDYGEK